MAPEQNHDRKGIPSLHELLNGEFSDIIIRCGETEIKAHRVLLALASGYFAAACKRNFLEGVEGVIDLSEHKLCEVEIIINHIYRMQSKIPDGTNEAVYFAQGYATADYFQIPDLKSEARWKFASLFAPGPVDMTMRTNFSAAVEIYSELAPALQKILIKTAVSYPEDFLRFNRTAQERLETDPEFSRDIALTLIDRQICHREVFGQGFGNR